MSDVIAELPQPQDAPHIRKFNTFRGVFLPTLLTILGAIMYLRTGWIVGHAGLGGAILIILMAKVITFSTALSIASVATNIRVKAGGAFSIISQSLGLEVSGSVSVPFYLAQAIAVALYVFAFTEGWLRIFPGHPEALVIFGSFAMIFAIAFISANLASRAHFLILAIQIIALGSVFLGSFSVLDAEGMTETPQVWGEFDAGNFWVMFAVFFPAVTGILAGVNLSGQLENPRRSIPIGLIGAVVVTSIVYLALAYWFSRVAPPAELQDNFLIMVDEAAFGPVILAGLLAATFSAGLTSLVGAPRILQAIAENDILPGGDRLAELSASGEPRKAMWITGGITLTALIIGLLAGGLNAIAPFMTMFFLITYAALNGVVLLEQLLGLVSFRPHFRVPMAVPFVGLVGCLLAMFLINPLFSLGAMAVIVGLYAYLSRRQLTNPWGDVRSGLFVTLAEWAAKRVTHMPDTQERAWKPNLLVPVISTEELLGGYRFLNALTHPRGSVHVLGLYKPGERHLVAGSEDVVQAFLRDGIFSRVAYLQDEHQMQGLRLGLETLHSAFFRPNAIFMSIDDDTDEEELNKLLRHAQDMQTGAILFAQHPIARLGREQTINVWIRDQSPQWEVSLRLSRLDLSLLLAYQVARNWQGDINLITVISDPAQQANGQAFLKELIDVGRMPRGTQALVHVGDFTDYLLMAPRADLQIFGMDRRANVELMHQVVLLNRTSCIFVQDSGLESALA